MSNSLKDCIVDNRIFNVNGDTLERLIKVFDIADMSYNHTGYCGCIFDPNKGLIWVWAKCEGASMYPVPLTYQQAAEVTFAWLSTKEAKGMCDGWDANADHDGSNKYGWRAYVEDWGHVGKGDFYTTIAVRPAFMWHGK